jgi:hypothetical protein
MTTIAFDGSVLATDSQVTNSDLICGTTAKIFKLKNGALVALCGSLSLQALVAAWLDGGDRPEIQEDDNLNGIICYADGTAFEISRGLRMFPATIPWAGGSGQTVALTAMHCGKNAVEAAWMACVLDIHSGLPVQSEVVSSSF